MNGIKKGRQGFTLIELLAVVLIMSLIVGIVAIPNAVSVKKLAEIKIDKAEQNLILSATKGFVLEYRNKNDTWKENVDSEGNVSFCISLNSLIETGYYKNADEYVIDNANNMYVHAMANENKVFKYNLISTKEEIFDKCGYKIFDSDLKNDKGDVNITDDTGNKNVGNLTYTVEQNHDKTNNYEVNIKLLAELGTEDIVINAPVYVAIVLDNSGSMMPGGDLTNWNKAKEAAISLSNTIINDLNDSYVALVQYNEHPTLVRGFEDAVLTGDMFLSPSGNTNVSGSLDLVSVLYKDLIKTVSPDSQFYTIILYDGEPTHTSALQEKTSKTIRYNNYSNYYESFYDAYNGNSSKYNYLDSTSSSISYVQNAANYLKSNNINSTLITIGYNNKFSEEYKKISSQTNELCSGSDYAEGTYVNKNSLLGKMSMHTLTYGFSYDETTKKLVSNNGGKVNTQSYGYYELDLTSYSSSDRISVNFDYSISNSYGFLQMYIGSSNQTNLSFFAQNTNIYSYVCTKNEIWDGNQYCDNTNGATITKTVLTGGRKYYIHIHFYNMNTYNTTLTINDISYSKMGSNVLLVDSSVDGYNKDVLSLSTEDESRLVYPSIIDGGKLNFSNSNTNSYAASYKKIDLTDKTGDYLFVVNATSSKNGYILISNSVSPQYAPGLLDTFTSITSSSCNTDTLRCVNAKTQDENFNFKLTGGSVYYVHFVGQSGLVINNMSLQSIGNLVYDTDFDKVSSSSCSNNDVVGCLQSSNSYALSFVSNNNGSIISSSKESHNSCAHSYIELDLTNKNGDKILKFNSTVSSEAGYDIGSIIITNSANTPNISNRVCNTHQGCVDISSGTSNHIRYWKLSGGKNYYVHFTYCKDSSSNAGADYFQINELQVYNSGNSSVIKVDDKVDYTNYFFQEIDKKLISTNKGISNSSAHSYLKIDLESYSRDDRFLVNMDAYISHQDIGKVILTESKSMPSYINYSYNYNSSSVFLNSTGNAVRLSSGDIVLYGGKTYYLHLIYYKNGTGNSYDDIFRINSIKIYKQTLDIKNSLDLEKILLNVDNYGFEDNGNGGYIANNTSNYSTTFSNFVINLTENSNKKFNLKFNTQVLDNSGINRIYVSTSSSLSSIYSCYYYNSVGSLYNTSCKALTATGSSDFSFELVGGKNYYVYVVSENRSNPSTLIINSINLEEMVPSNYYCYFDADTSKIQSLFANLSTEITKSVDRLVAEEAKLTLSAVSNKGISFNIVDSDGKTIPEIVKTIKLEADKDNKFEFNETYKFVLDSVDNVVCDGKESCVLDVQLFDVKLELISTNNGSKVITIPDLPTVTVTYKSGEAKN